MVNEASCIVLPSTTFPMAGVQSNGAGSSLVSITVLSVRPLRAGGLFALASVEIHGPIGDAVIEALIERGLAKRRLSVPIPD
jgi:hypothetical protein